MGLTAVSICAKNHTISTDGFAEVYSRQYGDWHCVSILDAEDEGVWSCAKKVSEESSGPVISANCVDSDFAEISLFIDGRAVNTFFIGQTYWDDEVVEPDFEAWHPFETGEKTLEQFLSENADIVFAEQALEGLKSVFGFPLIVLQ